MNDLGRSQPTGLHGQFCGARREAQFENGLNHVLLTAAIFFPLSSPLSTLALYHSRPTKNSAAVAAAAAWFNHFFFALWERHSSVKKSAVFPEEKFICFPFFRLAQLLFFCAHFRTGLSTPEKKTCGHFLAKNIWIMSSSSSVGAKIRARCGSLSGRRPQPCSSDNTSGRKQQSEERKGQGRFKKNRINHGNKPFGIPSIWQKVKNIYSFMVDEKRPLSSGPRLPDHGHHYNLALTTSSSAGSASSSSSSRKHHFWDVNPSCCDGSYQLAQLTSLQGLRGSKKLSNEILSGLQLTIREIDDTFLGKKTWSYMHA